MPLVEVKVFEEELSAEQTQALIAKLTDAVTAVTSEGLREATWVVVSEVPSGNWGIGGRPLGVEDARRLANPG